LDGTKFDSSRDRDSPFGFKLGVGNVIKGWDQVVPTMKKGEIAKVTIQPSHAYGEAGSPPKIPPNSTLVFEIELLSFSSEQDLSKAKDEGIMKKVVHEGTGYETPNYDAKCKVRIKCTGPKGVLYEEGQREIVIGNEIIPKGLQKALTSMKKGEIASVKVAPKYGFGEGGNSQLGIPPSTSLLYELEMIEFEKGKESWQLNSFQDKLDLALKWKSQGNSFFESQNHVLAVQKYKKALDLFSHDSTLKDDEKEKAKKEIKLPVNLNLAACYVKKKDNKKAIEHANKALEIDSNHVKGLWRRGVALTNNGDWHNAKKDFTKALELDPDNKAVKQSYANLNKIIAKQDQRDKHRYRNLFQRLNQEESGESKDQPQVANDLDSNK